MSDVIHSAVIEVGVDATGADAGLARIEAAATKTGKTLENLGGKSSAGIDKIGDGSTQAASKLDRATANMVGSIQRTTASMEAGSRSSSKYFETLANQRGVNLDVLKPYLLQLDAVAQKQAFANQALNASNPALERVGMSAKATAAAMRGIPAQFTDIVTSLQGGQKPLTVLLQQGGQLKDMFGGIGPAAQAMGSHIKGMINPATIAAAAVGALSYAFYSGSKEMQEFNKSLILSGNAAGTTALQMNAMAANVAKTVGTRGAAAEAMTEIAGSGKVAAANLEYFTRVAVQMEKTVGQSFADTAKDLAELGKSPVEASEKLNEKYNYLTASVYAQIKALQEQGRAQEAAATAQKAYADSFADRTKQIQDNLGIIERAFKGTISTVKSWWDAVLNVGRKEDPLEKITRQISETTARLDSAKNLASGKQERTIFTAKSTSSVDAIKSELDALRQKQTLLMEVSEAEKNGAAATAMSSAREQERINFMKDGEKYLSKTAQMEREIAKVRDQGKRGTISEEEANTRIAQIRAKNGDGAAAAIANLDGMYKIEQDNLKSHLQIIESMNKRGLLGDLQYLDQKYAAEKKSLDNQEALRSKAEAAARSTNQVGKASTLKADQSVIRNKVVLLDDQDAERRLAIAHKIEQEISAITVEEMKRRGDIVGAFTEEFSRKYSDIMVKAQLDGNVKLQAAIESAWSSGKSSANFDQTKQQFEAMLAGMTAELDRTRQAAEADGGLTAAINAQGIALDITNQAIPALQVLQQSMLAAAIAAGDLGRIKIAIDFGKTLDNQVSKMRDYAKDAASAWENAGDKIAASLEKAFGKGGKTAGDLLKSFTSGIASQIKIDEKYAAIKATGMVDSAKLQEKYDKERLQASLGMYGDMANAAKGFFDEQSAGYKILDGVAKAAHAAQVAMQLIEMGQMAIKAVLNQAGGDPYTAFPRMAAMAAAVGALGFAVGGGFSSDGGGSSAASIQAKQNTGTVLGDSEAKSNSIANSLDLIGDNSDLMLPLTQVMARALQNIESAIGGVANLVFRTNGTASGIVPGLQTGVLSKNTGDPILNMFGINDSSITKNLPIIGSLLGGLQGLWGKTTQNIVDSGFLAKGTFGQLSQGQGISQYASIDTTESSWFGLVKETTNRVIEEQLGPELSRQFAQVFTNLGEAIRAAGVALGFSSESIMAGLNSLAIDLPLSIKGLKGTELTDAIGNWLSTIGDTAAKAVIPGLEDFQQVGEGYLQTIVRVANGTEKAGSALKRFGIEAIKYGDIINKQGDVFAETLRQSIVRSESSMIGTTQSTTGVGQIIQNFGGSGDDLLVVYRALVGIRDTMISYGVAAADVTLAMIEGAGGLDILASSVQSFFENFYSPAEQMEAHGLALANSFNSIIDPATGLAAILPTTRAGFRAFIDGIDRSTAAGQEFYGSIISQSELAARYYAEVEAAAARTQGLRIQIMELEGNSAEAVAAQRRIELSTLSDTDQVLQMRIYRLQDEAAALAKANAVSAERFSLESQYAQLNGDNTLARVAELQAIDPANRALKIRIWALQDEKAAAQSATQSAGGLASAYNDAAKAQNEYLQGLVNFGKSIADFLRGLDQDKSLTPSTRLDNARSQYEKDLALSRNGDAEAQARLVKDSQTYLDVARENFGHGGAFSAIMGQIKSDLGGLTEVKNLDANLLALEAIKNAIASSSAAAQSTGAGITSAVNTVPFAITEANLLLLDGLADNFERLDTNLSGGLTRVEFGVAYAGQASEAAIDALFELTDTNHDGVISALEAGLASTNTLADRISSALGPKFDTLTAATNGLLNYEEFKAEFSGVASDETLQSIFNQLDTNNDGMLSKLEAGNANTASTASDSQLLQYIRENTYHPTPQSREIVTAIESQVSTLTVVVARLLEQIAAGQKDQTSAVTSAVVTSSEVVATAANKASAMAATS